MRSIYTARNGMSAQQKRLDVIAHNMSNINTDGFKKSRVDFEDCLYQTIRRVVQPQDDLNLRMGYGTLVGSTTRIMDDGKMLQTGVNTDIAIEGEGFFAIETLAGDVAYTRAGSFSVDSEGFLVAQDGAYVLDNNNDRIYVANSNFECDAKGNILVDGEVTAVLGVYNCVNPKGLTAVGTNRFVVSDNSGPMEQGENFTLRQGYSEGSNVQLEQEITAMIRSQRALSMASRALQTADNMDAQANQLRQ